MWNQFWFKSIDARQYAALRIAFGGLSVVYLLGLLPYVETQFSGLGWLRDIQQIAVQNGGSWSLFFIQAGAKATTLAYAIVWMGIIAAFMLMIGWQSRLAATITWLVWVSLWNRNPLLLDGDDAILKLMCFYLMLSSCGNCWSVDACLQIKPQQVSVWPLRLIQFQIALILCLRLGKIPQSRMAGWNNYAIRTHPSSVFALGWLEFHRQSLTLWSIGCTCWVYPMVGTALSIFTD